MNVYLGGDFAGAKKEQGDELCKHYMEVLGRAVVKRSRTKSLIGGKAEEGVELGACLVNQGYIGMQDQIGHITGNKNECEANSCSRNLIAYVNILYSIPLNRTRKFLHTFHMRFGFANLSYSFLFPYGCQMLFFAAKLVYKVHQSKVSCHKLVLTIFY